jgi:hypothetical protein
MPRDVSFHGQIKADSPPRNLPKRACKGKNDRFLTGEVTRITKDASDSSDSECDAEEGKLHRHPAVARGDVSCMFDIRCYQANYVVRIKEDMMQLHNNTPKARRRSTRKRKVHKLYPGT